MGVTNYWPEVSSGTVALLLEGIPLLLATGAAPSKAWPERLANWRRTRSSIAAQLQLGDGIVPWLRDCAKQAICGMPVWPGSAEYHRYLATLADAEQQLRFRISGLALPEHVRQSVLVSAAILLSNAELAVAPVLMDLERQALEAAALCREQCAQLPDLPAASRNKLAAQCESLLLDLIRPAQTRLFTRSDL
jgi:hypothetical protein